jgi:pimeloyl-ACP methyl ester carboxylesterase
MKTPQHISKQLGTLVVAFLLAGAVTGCTQGPQGLELARSGQAVGEQTQMSIVLVHGAWQGPWVWADVAQHLQTEGHLVAVANLPAHGTDPTPPTSANLEGYVRAVADAVHSLPGPVYLVGHSLAGIPISQFAENEPSSIAELIYYAAFVPADGESLLALANQDANSLINPHLTINGESGIASLNLSAVQAIMCADCSAIEAEPLVTNYRDEPLGPLAEPVHLTAANYGSVVKKYFFTEQDQAVTYPRQQAMASRITLADSYVMNSSHCPNLSSPRPFAAKLLTLLR